MVFGFFSRKAGPVVVNNESAAQQHFQFPPTQQQTPAPSIDKDPSPTGSDLLPPAGPVDSPSPCLAADENADKPDETNPGVLHALISSVPPQTLHAYTLAHLSPVPPSPFPFANPAAGLILHQPPSPPSPRTLSVLTEFFSNLTPPPKSHCVRCHKAFFELENTDRSCTVAHDDDSAMVDRVRTGLGTEYETLWGCCGRTVEGDGDQGPPDGWCYEGRHTTDLKRARFRADSTPHDDKLVSCAQFRCGEPPLPRRRSRVSRKRTRVDSYAGDLQDTISVRSSSHSRGHEKTASVASSTKQKEKDREGVNPRPAKRIRSRKPSSVSIIAPEDAMDIDPTGDSPPSPPKSPPRPPSLGSATSNAAKTKPKPKPKSKTTPSPPKPRSKGSASGTTVPLQRSPLSSSFTAPTSRPNTPSKRSTKVEVEILMKSPSMGSLRDGGVKKQHDVGKKGSTSILKDKGDSMVLRSAATAAVGSKKEVGVASAESIRKTKKNKTIGEVVETSVDGEAAWV